MTPEELVHLADSERRARAGYKHTINVCCAAGCMSMNSDQIKDALSSVVRRYGLDEEVAVKAVGCMGLCAAGPLVSVEPKGTIYQDVRAEHAGEIVQHLGDKPVERLELKTDIPFFNRQLKIVLENSGRIEPERIEDYLAVGGYQALVKALTEMTPAMVIGEVSRSGLRGRGGAGFPTGLKWGMVAKAAARDGRKYIVCNADEGDPGAFMDRSVLESDPHRVLEGMVIAAYAVGANQGYIYVRAEYPLAIKRLKIAIRQAEKAGLLGDRILGMPFSFSVDLRLGAGAFVCGEETALIASIEGHRGQPRPRPPYPAEYGLWGCPTLINNVETFANIAPIVDKGHRWFASIGTDKSKGTKVFALAGRIKNTGLVEVPMGIKLGEIINEVGGGIPEGKKFKAVQTGGPSGGCIPERFMDMPVDYESVKEAGSIMGSGGMIVMDETSSMVDVAKFFMEFCKSESCGKCVPCRVGTAQMHSLLEKIDKGEGTAADLALLEELCDLVRNTSLCGLGQTSPNPVVSTLRYFRHEYTQLLKDGKPVEPAQAVGGNGH